MPKVSEINVEGHDFLKLPTIRWYPEATGQKGLAKGGIYLLSGPPGSGKTTIAMEMMV
jgi:KaiC/GvpD/RAD55 family RecA-like ATPase